jgi:hypothetical protein
VVVLTGRDSVHLKRGFQRAQKRGQGVRQICAVKITHGRCNSRPSEGLAPPESRISGMSATQRCTNARAGKVERRS